MSGAAGSTFSLGPPTTATGYSARVPPTSCTPGRLVRWTGTAAADVRLILEWVRGQLGRFFAERRAVGELPASVDPDELADFCIVTVQGGLLVGKIKRDSTAFNNAVNHALAYIEVLKQAGAQRASRSDSKNKPANRRTTG